MTTAVVVLLCLLVLMLIFVAAVVSAAETAFTRVNRSRAEALAAADTSDADDESDGATPAEQLRRFSRRPFSTLASLTLVQVLCQVGGASIAYTIGRHLAGSTGGFVAAALCLAVLAAAIVWSRTRALQTPDSTAIGMVPILRAVAPLGWLTSGLVGIARRTGRDVATDPEVDEQQLLAIAVETAGMDPGEEALIKRVVAFDDTVVGDIMTPRTDLVTLRSGFAVGDALQVFSLHGLSRIPVTMTDSDVDAIIGAVHVKDLMVAHLDGRSDTDIDLFLREIPAVPGSQRIVNLLSDLRTGDLHMAIVIDEHGGVAGVATLEDIVEEIVGEIEDEFDRPDPLVELVDGRTVRADGRAEMVRLEEALGTPLPSGEFRTIAGCVFHTLARVPDVGDLASFDELDIEIEVVRMHGRRIAEVHVRRSQPLSMPLPWADLEEIA